MKHESLLSRERTALIIIDVQQKLLPAMHESDRVLKRCEILAEAAGILQIPVLATEQYPKGLGNTIETLSSKLPANCTTEKLCFSCARNEEFMSRLKDTGCSQILVCGIESHVCVLQTAHDLMLSGIQVHVAVDATSSRNPHMYHGAIMRMSKAGIIGTNTESALFEMLDMAGGDEFKAISKLIR